MEDCFRNNIIACCTGLDQTGSLNQVRTSVAIDAPCEINEQISNGLDYSFGHGVATCAI